MARRTLSSSVTRCMICPATGFAPAARRQRRRAYVRKLFIVQRLDGVLRRGFLRRVVAEGDPDARRDGEGEDDRRKGNDGAPAGVERDAAREKPAEDDADDT